MKLAVVLVGLLGCLQQAASFMPSAALRPARASSSSSLRMAKEGITFDDLDGSNVRVGIIRTRWNGEIVENLRSGVKEALEKCGVKPEHIFETEVPGAYELPLAARFLALSQTVDSIVCLGCLIKGETMHFEYIADAVSSGLMQVGLSTTCPTVFGVLTTLDEEQAKSRSSGDNNHGVGWGMTAVEMGLLRMSALGQGKASGMGFGKADGLNITGDKKVDGDGRKIGF